MSVYASSRSSSSSGTAGKLVLGLMGVVVMALLPFVLMPGCQLARYAQDPPAQTAGYSVFTGKREGLRVQFEYPEGWQRLRPEGRDDFEMVRMNAGLKVLWASADVSSWLMAGDGTEPGSATEEVGRELDFASRLREFRLVRHDREMVGGVEGEGVTYSYHVHVDNDPHLPAGTVIDRDLGRRLVAVEHGGRVYSLSLVVEAAEYDGMNRAFEHLLATFRFLD